MQYSLSPNLWCSPPRQSDLVLDLAIGNSPCGKGTGNWWRLRSLPSQAILWFTAIFLFFFFSNIVKPPTWYWSNMIYCWSSSSSWARAMLSLESRNKHLKMQIRIYRWWKLAEASSSQYQNFIFLLVLREKSTLNMSCKMWGDQYEWL